METRCQFFSCRSRMKQESTAGQGGGRRPTLPSFAVVCTCEGSRFPNFGTKHARGAYLILSDKPSALQLGPVPFVHGQCSGELQHLGSNTEHDLRGRSINHLLVGWTLLQQSVSAREKEPDIARSYPDREPYLSSVLSVLFLSLSPCHLLLAAHRRLAPLTSPPPPPHHYHQQNRHQQATVAPGTGPERPNPQVLPGGARLKPTLLQFPGAAHMFLSTETKPDRP